MSACGLSEHYREIFEITRLSDFMTILADGPVPAADRNGGTTMTETTIRGWRCARPGRAAA